ncbi:STAS domain-containing protein [Streptosporangium sp. G11]|uniref:STAS domain-containing protein n=1 Tax=Streptosporangium sp. G11 TaxID=3436926 RepID=UPI003EBDBCBF
MPPEGVNTLSISADVRGSAIVVRAIGELDYDYAPIFRRELTRVWIMGAGNASSGLPASSPVAAPPELPVPTALDPSPLPSETSFLLEAPLLPETSFFSGSPLLPETPFLSEAPLLPETPFLSERPFLSEVPPTSEGPPPSGPPSPLSPEPPSPFFPGGPPLPEPGSPTPLFPEGPSPLSPDVPPPDEPPSNGPPSNGPPSLSTTASPPPPPLVVPSSPEASPGTRAEGAPWLILDLEGLTFCDSTGLAELLWILRRSQETRTRLVVTGASRTLRHMMAITGLLPYFAMAASVEEVLSEMESSTAEGQGHH